MASMSHFSFSSHPLAHDLNIFSPMFSHAVFYNGWFVNVELKSAFLPDQLIAGLIYHSGLYTWIK